MISNKSIGLILKMFVVLQLLTGNKAITQEAVSQQRVLQLLEKTKNSYAQQNGVSMLMQYYYANESTPEKYIDSVSGSLVMSGNNYLVKMQGVETMVNARYNVTLFQEDHLMYLTRPAAAAYNPVAMLDSLFARAGVTQCTVTYSGQEVYADILFPPNGAYKQMQFVMDTATGYILKTKAVLKTVYLTQGADEESVKKQGYDEYAIVEVKLSGYRQEHLAEDYFNEARFFSKKDKEFLVSDQYRDYKIFVATPNL